MKFHLDETQEVYGQVAPLAGAWIEIRETYAAQEAKLVAPLAGAWIEMAVEQKERG